MAPEAGFPVTAEVASLGEDPYVDQLTRRSLGSPHPAPVPMAERDRARTLQPGVKCFLVYLFMSAGRRCQAGGQPRAYDT